MLIYGVYSTAFEKVWKGGGKDENPHAKTYKMELGNKYDALTNADN